MQTASDLVLLDVIAAECIYVLQSNYRLARTQIVDLIRSALALPAIHSEHPTLMERALALFHAEGQLGFQDAYMMAAAEASGIGQIVSFDRGIRGSAAVTRIEP